MEAECLLAHSTAIGNGRAVFLIIEHEQGQSGQLIVYNGARGHALERVGFCGFAEAQAQDHFFGS
jgi:hypothetical protein